MRLRDCETLIVAPPAPGWGGRWWALVKLTADDGTVGWGECYAGSIGPLALKAVIADVFARHCAGADVWDTDLMFRRALSSGFSQRPDPTVIGAFSGIEIACRDLQGKAAGLPVWKLLGGRVNPKVRLYTYLYPDDPADAAFYSDADRSAAAAARFADEGWTAVKFDPAGPYGIRGGRQPAVAEVDRSARFCAALREAVGARADLLFGTHGQFTPAGAIRVGRSIEPWDPLWFEEPVPPGDPDAMAQVARAVRVPIAAGERLATRWEFLPLLRAGACAILQPALGRAGGLGEGMRIAQMAEAFGAQVAPHLYAGPVEWAANLHLCTTAPNALVAETIDTPFHRALIGHALVPEGGWAAPGDAPGLGIEVDEALARAHAYEGDRLPLEMQEAPPDPLGAGHAEG